MKEKKRHLWWILIVCISVLCLLTVFSLFKKERKYQYLCIGNSITVHGVCEYWWGEWGMAASGPENDYVHVLGSLLGEDAQGRAVNFSSWEMLGHDRAQTLMMLDSELAADPDLIVLQLGENVVDTKTLKEDYTALIRYVCAACPDAAVVMIGCFWENPEVEQAKKEACEECGITMIPLDEIMDEEYYCGKNTEVLGEDGQLHTVEHDGVAKHPGDKAMKYIAEKIVQALERITVQ